MKWFLFTSQRHPEHRGAAARSHEEDSLQHPGTEGWDQLPQRVLSVIQASFQSNVHWLIMPFHWWASRTGEAWDWATPGFVVFSMEQRGRTEDSSEPIRQDWKQEHLCTLWWQRIHYLSLYEIFYMNRNQLCSTGNGGKKWVRQCSWLFYWGTDVFCLELFLPSTSCLQP